MNRTILVIDDNKIERTLLTALLKNDFTVITASSGVSALEILYKSFNSISAVVLDLIMPGMDGFQVMKLMRESPEFAQIPIIVSTSQNDDETREKAFVHGANGFVSKPYNKVLLLHEVRNAVNLREMATISERIKSAEQKKVLLDNLPIGTALYEYDGNDITIKHINKTYLNLVKRTRTSKESPSIFSVINPDDRPIIWQELFSAIRQNRKAIVDVRVLSDDGTYKPFHTEANIIPEQDGKYSLYTTCSPITDKAMSIQEMFPIALSTMMSSFTDYSYVKDKDSHYLCCSRSFAEILCLGSEQSVIGKTDYDLFDSSIADVFLANDAKIFDTGKPIIEYPIELPLPDGSICYALSSIYPIVDATAEIIGLYGMSRDISKERKLNFELNTLLNVIPSRLLKYSADEGEQFAYINRNFIESLGYTEKQFKEKFHNSFHEMIYIEDREQAEAEVIKQEGNGEIGKFNYRVEAADGQLRWIHDEGVKVTDQEGKSWYYVTLFDITQQQEALERLRISEEINRLAIAHSGKIVTQFNIQNKTLVLPDSFNPIFELPQVLNNVPQGQIDLGRISQETAIAYSTMFEDISNGSPSGTATYQQNSSIGWRWLEAQYTTVFSNSGSPQSAVITFTDITEQLEKEVVYTKWQQSLTDRPKESYTLFRYNLSSNNSYDSCEGTLLDESFTTKKITFNDLTAAYVNLYVYEEDREKFITFMNSDSLLANYYRGKRFDVIEYRIIKNDGTLRWLQLSSELVEYPNSNDIEVYLMFEDINDDKLTEIQTREQAQTDSLTGVLNRATFIERMETIIQKTNYNDKHALFMIDVDNFKHVNDNYGHDAGDYVLCELTKSIHSILRPGDLIGRLGGDEFLIFLKNIPNELVASSKAKAISAISITPPCADNSSSPDNSNITKVTTSIGIAMIPQNGNDFETLYKKVDNALYKQKKNGKNGKNGFTFVKE